MIACGLQLTWSPSTPSRSGRLRSRGRLASARPRWPSASPRVSMPRPCSRKPRTRSSPTSTRARPARRCSRSSSTCSTATASSCRCGSRTSSRRPRSATTCSTRTRSSRISTSTTTSCSSTSGCTTCSRPTCRRPISSSTCRRPTEVLERRLRRDRTPDPNDEPRVPDPVADYVKELNEAYQHFFFHYTATPLLVVETSDVDSRQRRRPRRTAAPDGHDEPRHALLRAAAVGRWAGRRVSR